MATTLLLDALPLLSYFAPSLHFVAAPRSPETLKVSKQDKDPSRQAGRQTRPKLQGGKEPGRRRVRAPATAAEGQPENYY